MPNRSWTHISSPQRYPVWNTELQTKHVNGAALLQQGDHITAVPI